MHRAASAAVRISSAAVYPILTAVNLWVLELALTAVNHPPNAVAWWLLWGVFYLVLIAARNISHTRPGQWIGALRTYAFSVHPVLIYVSAPGLALMIALSRIWDGGIFTAGIATLILQFAAFTAAVYGFIHARKLHLHAFAVKTAKCLPHGTLTIVHLSDLHLGYIQNDRFVRNLVRRVNSLTPDLICITGDTFSDTLRPIRAPFETADRLSKLRARYGVYACFGNHDAGETEKMASFFERAHIRVLEDDALFPAPNIALIGLADATPGGVRMRRASIGECMIGTDPLQYRIVLDHQPRDILAIAERGADLLLSGHTHGGQFFPVTLAIRRRFRCYSGEYRFGRLHIIVSTGSGAGSPPIRIGTSGEIGVITVRQMSQYD